MDFKSGLKSGIQEVLYDVPRDQIVTVIFYAMRLITNRRVIDNVDEGFMVGLPSEPSFEDAEIALRVIRRIESDAKMPLQNLNDSDADCYIRLLGEINDEITMAARPLNLERGRARLQDLLKRSGFLA